MFEKFQSYFKTEPELMTAQAELAGIKDELNSTGWMSSPDPGKAYKELQDRYAAARDRMVKITRDVSTRMAPALQNLLLRADPEAAGIAGFAPPAPPPQMAGPMPAPAQLPAGPPPVPPLQQLAQMQFPPRQLPPQAPQQPVIAGPENRTRKPKPLPSAPQYGPMPAAPTMIEPLTMPAPMAPPAAPFQAAPVQTMPTPAPFGAVNERLTPELQMFIRAEIGSGKAAPEVIRSILEQLKRANYSTAAIKEIIGPIADDLAGR